MNKNTIIQLPYYLKITDLPSPNNLHYECELLSGNKRTKIYVSPNLVQKESINLEIQKTEKLTPSKLADTFSNIPPKVLMQVCFVKSTNKQERVLTGYRVNNETTSLGRSNVHDLEVTAGSPLRQVDHRTLKWVIVDNVKYELK